MKRPLEEAKVRRWRQEANDICSLPKPADPNSYEAWIQAQRLVRVCDEWLAEHD